MADKQLHEYVGTGLKTNPPSPSVGQEYDLEVDFAETASKASVDTLDGRVDDAESDIAAIEDDVADHESRIVALEGALTPSYTSIWLPDAPPASPSIYDDEFTAGSLDPKWVEFDPGAGMVPTIDTVKKMVVLTDAAGSSFVAGIVQSLPAGELAIYTRWFASAGEGSPSPAFILPADLTSGSAVFTCYAGVYRSGTSTPGIAAYAHTNYTGTAGTLKGNAGMGMNPAFMRLRLPGDGNFSVDASPDGVGWHHVFTNTLGVSPAYFGLGMWTASGVPAAVRYPFFRVITGAGASAFGANHIGRLVNVPFV